MPKTKHAAALLDEVKAPTHAGTTDAAGALLKLQPSLDALRSQATRYQALANAVKLGEADEVVRARFELFFQTFGAMQRHITELEAASHSLVEDFRQLDRYDAEVRAFMVDEHGYAG